MWPTPVASSWLTYWSSYDFVLAKKRLIRLGLGGKENACTPDIGYTDKAACVKERFKEEFVKSNCSLGKMHFLSGPMSCPFGHQMV